MKKVIFIRHAESYFNILNGIELSGDAKKHLINCGITENGIIQSKKLDQKFDHVISSPLKRTLKTLNNSNIRYSTMEINELFREHRIEICDFFEGEEIQIETIDEIDNRIKKCKEYLKNLNYKEIGIITHSDFIWHFTKYEFNGEQFGKWLANTESIEIEL